MFKRLLQVFLATSLLLSFSTLAYAGRFEEDGSMSDTDLENTETLFKYDPSQSAEGIRCSLYKGETYTGKTFNILNHQPAETSQSKCVSLGTEPKTESLSWSDKDFDYYTDSNFPGIGTDSTGLREYIQNDNAIAEYATRFGVPVEEINSGAYSVLIEPIVQIRIGSPQYTIIGTPPEIASYILDSGYQDYNDNTSKSLTPEQFDSLMYDNYPNLFHRRIPSSMFVLEGRLGLNPGSAGKFYSSEITTRSFGSGCFVLYKGASICPYKGSAPHGTPDAKHPTDGNQPCTCCPWTGPWLSLTTDPNDNTNIPAIKLYNKQDIDDSKPGHGSTEAKDLSNGDSACICTPKGNTEEERPTDVIPKDYLNMQFKSETASKTSSDDYEGCDPDDGDEETDITGSRLAKHNETGDYKGYWDFLGDRKYTANGSNLTVSKSYNDITLPTVINHYPLQYERDHEKDDSKTATAKFPNVTAYFYDDDEEDGGSYSKTVKFDSKNYTAEQTVFETAKEEQYPSEKFQYNKDNSTNVRMWIGPEESIKMLPSYKMKYFDDVTGSRSDIWMLASGIRTFTYKPFLDIQMTHSAVNALSPWSRDYEDLSSNIPTTKAGNAIKVDGSDINIKLTMTYYEKDPFFQSGNSSSIPLRSEYVDAMEYLTEELSDLHMISNAPYTGDDERLIWNNLGLSRPGSEIIRKSLINNINDSTALRYTSPKVSVTRLNILGGKDTKTATTVGGITPSLDSIPEAASLFVARDGWYSEDYEGLLKVTIEQEIKIRADKNQWMEINRYISDWLDRTSNTIPNPVAFDIGGGCTGLRAKTVYTGENFILGFGQIVEEQSFGECDIPNMILPNNYFEYKIRGSAYDQH